MKSCRFTYGLLLWAIALLTHHLQAADSGQSGFARNDNFTILTPRQETAEEANAYAEEILQAAEQLRAQIARTWLGSELPERQGRTLVTVSWDPTRDAGLTWAKDDPQRNYHALFLATPPGSSDSAASTLAHEMVHVVLATAFPHPNRLPTWLEEGIACQYDDLGRHRQRQLEIARWTRSGHWPRISSVLSAQNIRASDRSSYTVAASVTALLLSRDQDRQKLLAFGQHGAQHSWDTALQEHYGIAGVDQLQRLWQAAVLNASRKSGLSYLTRR